MVGAFAAEWTKLWTVRSSWASIAAAAALSMLYPLIIGVTVRSQHDAGWPDPLVVAPTAAAGSGIVILGQLALITLVTLAVAGEYATGSIRTTLQCVPVRGRLLLAKTLVLAPVLAVTGGVLAGLGTVAAALAMGSAGPPVEAGALWRLAGGATAYLGLIAGLVVAVAAVVRSVAGGITVTLLLVLLLPMMLDQSSIEILGRIAAALPGSAGQALIVGEGRYGTGAPFLFTPALVTLALAYRAGLAGRMSACWGFAGLAAAGAGIAVVIGKPDGALFVPVVLTMFGLVPWLIGRGRLLADAPIDELTTVAVTRVRAAQTAGVELLAAGTERIAQLEQAQQSIADRARLRERAALAEEMHDAFGHELSLIALRAGGLELASDLPARQREAARQLRTATAAATVRLAEIVAVLRDAPAPARSAPGAPGALVARARESGLAVQLRERGQPPPPLAATVHRLVQEGLTNAAKHAPGAEVTIAVESGAGQTTVTVANPPSEQAGPAEVEPGTGYGLAGLRERVRLLGGELTVTRPAGGFQLAASLPHSPSEPGEFQ